MADLEGLIRVYSHELIRQIRRSKDAEQATLAEKVAEEFETAMDQCRSIAGMIRHSFLDYCPCCSA